MRLALREAVRASEHDDVPIGAVVVRGGEVIGSGHNERELRADPTAHAEMIALREAARTLGSWRVLESVMYVTLEPCAMCAGAIVLSRLPRLVFGANDPKAGAAGSVLDVLDEPRLEPPPPGGEWVARRGMREPAPFVLRTPAVGGVQRARPGASSSNLSTLHRRGGRAVECAGLENRYGPFGPSGVRIPPSPLN